MVKISDLGSRIPGNPFSTVNRLDPFWDHVWERGSMAGWKSRRRQATRHAAKLRASSSWFIPDEARITAALDRLHVLRREVKLELLGAIDSWRTMTLEQAAAFQDSDRMFANQAALVQDLYALDLVDVGHTEGFIPHSFTRDGLREWLVRPTRSARFDELVEPRLTFPEMVQVTGGAEFNTGGQYDRHNVLATELALRFAEFLDVAAVLGEKWSTASELLFDTWGQGSPVPFFSNRTDLTVVRGDGLRIAVELTASAGGKSFERKVRKWVHQLSVGSTDSQGTVVLFVTVGDQFPKPGDNDQVHRQAKNSIARMIREYPGTPAAPTASRVFVAGWHELFPAKGEVCDDFVSLPVQGATGLLRMGAQEVWEDTFLFDDALVPFRPLAHMDPFAVVDNARMLFGSPWWLRQGDRPQIAFDAVRELWPDGPPGFTREDLMPRGGTPAAELPERVRV